MRKFLLTTSLVAFLASANSVQAKECCDHKGPVRLYLGGSLLVSGGTVDEDNSASDLRRDTFSGIQSEVFVEAKGNHDGLNYGALVEFHNEVGSLNNNLAERFIYLENQETWGLLEVGNVEGAGRRLSVKAPTNFGTGGINGLYAEFINVDTVVDPHSSTNNGSDSINGLDDLFWAFNSQNDTKISYYTPSFEGLQFGISYSPNEGNFIDSRTVTFGGFEDIVETGINYTGDFDGVGIAFNAGYNFGTAITSGQEDLNALQTGVQVSFDGFTVGGGYVNQFDSGLDENSTNDDDTEGYNFGASYEIGDVVVGFNGLIAEGEDEAASSDNKEYEVYSLGLTYNFVPGMALLVEGFQYNHNADSSSVTSIDNDGLGGLVALKAEF